jgi:hypothetical protein
MTNGAAIVCEPRLITLTDALPELTSMVRDDVPAIV